MTVSKKLRNFTFTLIHKNSLRKKEKQLIHRLFLNNINNNILIKDFVLKEIRNSIYETGNYIENITILNTLLPYIHDESMIVLPHLFTEKEQYIIDEIEDIRKKYNIFIKLDYLPQPHIYLNGPSSLLSDIRIRVFQFLKNIYRRKKIRVNPYSKIDIIEPNERSYRYIDYSFNIFKFYFIFFYKKRQLEKILSRNRSYLNIIDIGSGSATIRILAKKMKYINRTLFKLKKLLHTIYKVVITQPIFLRKSLIFYEKNQQIIIFSKNRAKKYLEIERTGSLSLELMFDYSFEEFICGKKNGKINKIVRETDIHLSLLRHTEFTIILNGPYKNIYKALHLIEDEYPAELNFSVDEKLHKRIIGVGGKNIQEMMKRYGVYIKFMNSHEALHNSYGGNVIIKTPKKNRKNLLAMKREIFTTLNLQFKKNNCQTDIKYKIGSIFDYSSKKSQLYYDYTKVDVDYQIFYFKFELFSQISFSDVERMGFRRIDFNDGYFSYYIRAKRYRKIREEKIPAILSTYDWGMTKKIDCFRGKKTFFFK